MRILIGFIVCLLLNLGTVSGADLIQWQTDYNTALSLSKEQKRPLFVYFYGDDCPPCRAMEAEIFTNVHLATRLNREFIPVKVKVADQPALAKQMAVTAIPTDIILTSDGQIVHRRQGGIKQERFGQYLNFLAEKISVPAPVINPAIVPLTVPSTVPSTIPTTPTVVQNVPQNTSIQAPIAVQNEPVNIVPNVTPAIVSPESVEAKQPPVDPFFFQQPTSHSLERNTVTPVLNTANMPLDPFANQQATPSVSETVVAASPIPPSVDSKSLLTSSAGIAVPQPPLNMNEMASITVEVPLALEGYCPVILNTDEKWVPGNPAFYTMFRGHIFRFSSAEAMDKFMQNPMKYIPMAMGEDIVLMIDRNKHVYGNRKFGAWYKDRVFLFDSQESLDMFASKPDFYTDIALKYEIALKNVHGRY